MIVLRNRLLAIIGVNCLLHQPLYSATPSVVDESPAWWQSSHQVVSATIGSWSSSIDAFLSGRQNLTEENDSYIQVRFGPIFDESSISGFFDFNARLKLPNTQDRLRLVIESDGGSLTQDNEPGESTEQSSIVDAAFSSNLSAAVRYIQKDLGAELDSGVLVDFPMNPFIRLRFRQGNTVKRWNWWQKEEAFAYYSKGIGARYNLGFGHLVSPTFDYGADFGVTWLDKENSFFLRENFFIHHFLSEKDRLSYKLSFLHFLIIKYIW